MKKLNLYVDGTLVPQENIGSIRVTDNLLIIVELIYPDKRERIHTDSSVRNIEIKK
jgi:hypothetical protein